MQHVSELFSGEKFKDKPWLIVGKGPSFSEINNLNLADFYTFGLNHVVKKVENLDITHLIDFDVFEACEEEIYKKAKYLCMPINPHFGNKPSEVTIKDLVLKNATLKKLSDEGRLFWYNHLKKDRFLSDNNRERLKFQDVEVKYFSAEVPFYLLGMFGIKELYSVGIDGGCAYNQNFCSETLLANGRTSFDAQFDEIINSIEKFDLVYSPIDARYPVKVYVGSQEEQMLSVKVLEYSIKKRTKVAVEVYPMHRVEVKYGVPKDPDNRQRTPFSFQRFTIPERNGFSGRAIYVDSDMQVFKDIRQLWNLPMGANDLFTVKKKGDAGRDLQFSVMLLDCDKLKWSVNDIVAMLDNGELNYHSLMKEMRVAKNIGVKIPQGWNCLEWFKEGESGLVHYTDMNTQPWVSAKNPLCKIWMADLIEAIDTGFIDIAMIKDHVEKSWVRPSLLYQIEHRILDSLKLPKEALALDKDFVAPYQGLEHVVRREKNKKCKESATTIFVDDAVKRILKSPAYKWFLKFIPSVKRQFKELKNISADVAHKLENQRREALEHFDEKKREEILNEILSAKKLLSEKIERLEKKFLTKIFPSIKRKLKEINKLASAAAARSEQESFCGKPYKKNDEAIKAAALLKPELYSGERQVYDSIDQVRKYHVGRYEFATKFIKKEDRVLDAACGIGYGSFLINKEVGSDVTGVDISQESIEFANENYNPSGAIKFMVSDILKLDLPEQSFDVAVSFETIEYVKEDREVLQKFYKLLKPSGLLICSTPNEDKMHFADGRLPFHIGHYTPSELKELLTSNGFEVLEIYSQYDKCSVDIHLGDDGLFNIAICRKI